MNKKILLVISGALIIICVAIIAAFSCKIAPSIEQQIAKDLGVAERDISLFDSQSIGGYQIAGVRYGSNQYGMAWILNKKDAPQLIWVKTSEKLVQRADDVWVVAMSAKEGAFYVFLSANENLSSIVLEGEEITTHYIDHSPSLVIAFHQVGSNTYQLIDKDGNILR